MTKFALVVILFFVSSFAGAQIWTGAANQVCPAGQVQTFSSSCGPTGYVFTSGVAACQGSIFTDTNKVGKWAAPTCQIWYKSPDARQGGDCTIVYKCTVPPPPPECPSGSSGGAVTYTTGYASGAAEGSAVVSKVVPDGAFAPGGSGVSLCSGKCMVRASAPDSCHVQTTAGPNGYFKMSCTSADSTMTGAGCTATPENSGNPPEPPATSDAGTKDGKCPAGSTPTGTDRMGMTICTGTAAPPVPPKTSTTAPPVTTANPDGGSTTTQTTATNNADGSTTTVTKTTVTAPDGTQTTTVDASTTAAPNGTPGQPDKPDSDLCKQNPSLTICKNSQVIGKCAETTCTGDAIQCATLRAARTMECRQEQDIKVLTESDAYELGKAAAAGNDPMESSLPNVGNASLVALPAMSAGGWLSGGALPADKSITIQGMTVVIPLSKALAYLVVLRYALMVVALLVSFRILSGAIIRE